MNKVIHRGAPLQKRVWYSNSKYLEEKLGIKNRNHNINLVPIVDVGVGNNVVVALGVDVELVVVIVVVVDVVVDVDDDGEDVQSRGQEGHLRYTANI